MSRWLPEGRLSPDVLRQWMKREAYTNEDLAETLGVSISTISHWRSGRTRPKPYVTWALRALDSDEWVEPMKPEQLATRIFQDGWTQRRLAIVLGLSYWQMKSWLTGRSGGAKRAPIRTLAVLGATQAYPPDQRRSPYPDRRRHC